ncbi:MAG: helix-turn-helix transcriptional regulator [Longicatena sp.]
MILIKVGNKIRRIRIYRKISQEELSFRSGVSRNYISDTERGTRNISILNLERLSKGLNVDIKEFFTNHF